MKRYALCLLVAACASPITALRDDNHRLGQTVTELRADRRAQDRTLRDLQRQLDEARSHVATSAIDGSMPSLPLEVATPSSDGVAAAPRPIPRVVAISDDGEEIIYEGDAALGRIATLDDDDRPPVPRRDIEPAKPTRGARRPPPTARPLRTQPRDRDLPSERGGDAANDYRAAVELVKSAAHDPAVAALRAFLVKYPRHDYADNAQYWLGETYYAHKDYKVALAEFRNVIETYPRGNKVPDALLKVGYCYQALGQTDKARAVLEQVVNLYPKTEPAALATKRLETQ